MTSHRRFLALACAVSWWSACTQAADVSFKQAFGAASEQDVVVISAQPGDVLVIESGEYVTNGRRLIVSAERARLVGDATFAFFSLDSAPPVIAGVADTGNPGPPGDHVNCARSGCPGKPGEPGKTGAHGTQGAPASNMLLDLQAIDGAARLTLRAAGQRGGQGQTGGQGGTGGRGGDGATRSCGGALGLDTRAGPGNGGAGATGGSGGVGGPGGPGGDGGAIVLHDKLAAPWVKQVIEVDLGGGMGGTGGDPGAKGRRGTGGGMGRGNSCGGGGHGGPDGAEGPEGERGNTGLNGRQGSLQFSSLEVGADPQGLPHGAKAERLILSQTESATPDCASGRVTFSQTAQVSDEQVIVKVLDSKPRSGRGVQRITVVANLSRDNPHVITAFGEVERTRTPIVRFVSDPIPRPAVRWRCPVMNVEIETNVIAVSIDSELGKVFRQPAEVSQTSETP